MEKLADKIKAIYACNMTENELFADLANKIEEVYNKYYNYHIYLKFEIRNVQCIQSWEKRYENYDLKDIIFNFLIPDKFSYQTIENWLKENGLQECWDHKWIVKLNK